jgi:hypothetical protein
MHSREAVHQHSSQIMCLYKVKRKYRGAACLGNSISQIGEHCGLKKRPSHNWGWNDIKNIMIFFIFKCSHEYTLTSVSKY